MRHYALRWLVQVLASVFCGLSGSLIAFIPHIAIKAERGDWEFYHDQDEVLYRMIAKPALDGSWQMRDVFVQADRNVPTNYSWMQFVPTSHLAKTLGYNALSLGQFWRLFGGFGAGIAIYFVFCTLHLNIKHAILFTVLCTLLALTDAGFASGRILIENIRLLYYILQNRTPKGEATSFTLYRVITPLWNLPVSIVAAALLSPSFLKRNPFWAIATVLMTALTVMLYFFQWTALLSGGGLCLACFLVWDLYHKTEYRRASFVAISALIIGVTLGLPQILANAETFSSPEMKPILDRVGRGQQIPWGHASRWNNVMNRWAWIKIVIAFVIAFRLRNRGLMLLSSIGAMGYLLSISVFVTSIEFENWHWLYVINPFLAIVIISGLMHFLFEYNKIWLACTFVLFTTVSGLYFRYYEAITAPDAIEMREWSEGVKPMRDIMNEAEDNGRSCIAGLQASRILSLSIPGGRTLFHEPHTAHTSLIPDQEVHERYVLNYWLMGGSREELETRPSNKVFKMFIFADTRPEWDRETVKLAQLEIFNRLEQDNGTKLMKFYEPKWLLLPVDSLKNPPVRGGKWHSVAQSGQFILWKKSE